jgi:hypothetical protein
MSIALDALTFARLLDLVMPGTRPSPSEARTVLQIAQLAAGIDLDDDASERGLLNTLTRHLCAVAEIPISTVPVLSPLPGDDEERSARLASLAHRLATTRARELAYVLAYLLIVVDLELAPVETELLDGLRRTLGIEDRRAAELLAAAAELVTPGAARELEGEAAHL